MDSADILRSKVASLLKARYEESLTRDYDTWLDIAQSLAQTKSVSDIVTRDDLSLVLNMLQEPGSELYLKALELAMLSY